MSYLPPCQLLFPPEKLQDSIKYPVLYKGWTDNLGSYLQLIDNTGASVFEAQYDAWGRQEVTKNNVGFHRGYTGHEMLPEFGLINMNGRLYDPLLGRFLSPDNYVQLPDFSQSLNRYSYCLNNPLKYTDPSGEWFGLDDFIVSIVGGVVNLGVNLLSGNIHSIGQGVASFALGAAAGEVALYGQVEVSAFLLGAGNSIINQGFTNGWNNINWLDATVAGGMSLAFSVVGSEISNLYSNQLNNIFDGISNDLLRNTLINGTTSSLTGFTIEGGLALANGDNLADILNAGLHGAELGFVSGTISGIGNAISLKNKHIDESFFDNAKYSDKVLKDIQREDFHSFPESVTAFEIYGIKTKIVGNDGKSYQKLEIPGWYKGYNGNFEFIKDSNGVINHRFFKPN